MKWTAVLRSILLFVSLVVIVFCAAISAAAGDSVSTAELISNMKKYDGRQVTIKGEVIGDIMVRGTNAWITVNDDRYSKKSVEEGGELIGMSNAGLGVWLSATDAKLINVCGGYKSKGAIVRVTGIFNRACAEHGGDTDIHARSLEVITDGYTFNHPFSYAKLIVLLILSAAAAGLWFLKTVRQRSGLREVNKE